MPKRTSYRAIAAATALLATLWLGGCRLNATVGTPPVVTTVGFYDDLAPYGEWVEVGTYGTCWAPYGVPPGWRPYTHGHWVYTQYGLTWVSGWNWGWAPFHYGRWWYDASYGWVWVPGTVWGPAWCAWRHGGGWVGWAPLPPDAEFRAGVGITFGSYDIARRPHWWCFAGEHELLATHLVIAPYARNVTYITSTRNITRVRYVGRHVVNESFHRDQLTRFARRRVEEHRIVDVRRARDLRGGRVRAGEVRMFRPRLERETIARLRPEPRVPRAAKRIDQAQRRRQDEVRRELETRHNEQLQDLQRHQRQELENLQRQKLQESQRRSKLDALRRRQEAERRALDQQKDRENRSMRFWQQREDRNRAPRKVREPKYRVPPKARRPQQPRKQQPRKQQPQRGGKSKDKGKDRNKDRGKGRP